MVQVTNVLLNKMSRLQGVNEQKTVRGCKLNWTVSMESNHSLVHKKFATIW